MFVGVIRYRRARSPAWHRRLRHRRAAARSTLRNLSGTCTLKQARAAARALFLLQAHHTRPLYRVPRIVSTEFVKLFGTHPMTWRNWDNKWPKSSRSPNQQQRKDQKSRDQDKDKKDKEQQKFPAYDAGNGGSTSSGSSSSGLPSALAEPAVIQILKTLAAKDESLAPHLEGLIPDPLKEDVREKQRILNQVRKLQQKVERKEQAIARKEGQMVQFLEDIRQHVLQEKQRHQEEIEQLRKELSEAKDALQQIKDGKPPPEEEPGMELDQLLSLDGASIRENDELKKKIALMEDEKNMQAAQMYAMQQQMEAFMRQFFQIKSKEYLRLPQQIQSLL